MNFLTFISPIILYCFVCTESHPATDSNSAPQGGDGNEVSKMNEVHSSLLDTNLGRYMSEEFIQFDLSLLYTLSNRFRQKNVVISPASIRSLLALLTKVYSKGRLTLLLKEPEKHPKSYSFLLDFQTLLQNNKTDVTIESRSKIFQATSLPPIAIENAANIQTIDFSNPQAADTINQWVNESTRGLISSAIDRNDINELTKLVLLNSIYLKAKWDITFDRSKTSLDCFYSVPGECHKVNFMYIKRELKRAYFPKHQALMFELPFSDARYTITFIVPQGDPSVNDTLGSIKNDDLFKLSARMTKDEESITLILPRTSIEFADGHLMDTLRQFGTKSFFGKNSKLDSMLREHTLFAVDTLFHRARIILNEEGAEAAAVTGGVETRSFHENPTIRVNRPFMFFFRDASTGLIIFEGIVHFPDKEY